MKINLTQSEIEQAIVANVTGTLILTPGTQISVELFSPRGSKEINAAVVLTPAGAEVEPAKAPATRKRAAATETVEAAATTGDAAVSETAETSAAETSAETVVETGTEGGNVVAETVEETGTGEVADKPKSLFGNLNRPKNA